MEIANTDIRVIVHYNVVNGGDKQGHAQASTVIYKMKDEKAAKLLYDYIRNMDDGIHNLVYIDAYRKQRGEWRNVLDTVNINNVTYIEWPKDVLDEFVDADSTE